jgi:hypothetical protein
MTLEESPDDDGEERAQEKHQRLDLWADKTIYGVLHDHLDSRPSLRLLLHTL